MRLFPIPASPRTTATSSFPCAALVATALEVGCDPSTGPRTWRGRRGARAAAVIARFAVVRLSSTSSRSRRALAGWLHRACVAVRRCGSRRFVLRRRAARRSGRRRAAHRQQPEPRLRVRLRRMSRTIRSQHQRPGPDGSSCHHPTTTVLHPYVETTDRKPVQTPDAQRAAEAHDAPMSTTETKKETTMNLRQEMTKKKLMLSRATVVIVGVAIASSLFCGSGGAARRVRRTRRASARPSRHSQCSLFCSGGGVLRSATWAPRTR